MNLFLLPGYEADEYAELLWGEGRRPPLGEAGGDVAAGTLPPPPLSAGRGADCAAVPLGHQPRPPARGAEVMVMIAEPAGRRRGLARDAVLTMMEWGECGVGVGAANRTRHLRDGVG